MSARVFLVGAGPGDPELLTLKALRLLRSADVVLHDDLVGAGILALIPPTILVRNVGKRCGSCRISQEAINRMMVEHARAGRVVVRLKGGDPQVFGHAWEEIGTLRDEEIDFEIVPGITAALGAAAACQIPLTARSFAPGVVFVTYRRAAESDRVRWRTLVASELTLVVYMPGESYENIASDLHHAGLDWRTPCALVSRASTWEQIIKLTSLGRLRDQVPLPAPTLLIIGEVARVNLACVDSAAIANLSASFDESLPQ